MKFLLSKNTKIIIFFLVLILLLLIFIYLDKKTNQNKNKELFETISNLIVFKLNTEKLDKKIKINKLNFLSYDNGSFIDINDKIDKIAITDSYNNNNNVVQLNSNQINELRFLNNNLSDYNTVNAINNPNNNSTTTNIGLYKFTIVGKKKDGTNIQYKYNIIALRDHFERPFFQNHEGFNFRTRLGEQNSINSYWGQFRSARGTAEYGDSDTAYFIPKKKDTLKFEIWISDDIDPSELDISLVWTGTNEKIEPTDIVNYSTLRSEYGNTNDILGAKKNNTVIVFDVDKHVISPSSFNLTGIKNNVSTPIAGNYDNYLNIVSPNLSDSTRNNLEIIDDISGTIEIDSIYSQRKSIDLIYNFDTTTDISKIGIMQFEFDLSDNNITVEEFIDNILENIHVGGDKLIRKNNFVYSLDYNNSAIYLLLIRSDLYAESDIKNWLDEYIGKSYYSKDKYFICGFKYDQGNYINKNLNINNNNNNLNVDNIEYSSLGCYNTNGLGILSNKFADVNSIDACYQKAKNSDYKYFGLTNPSGNSSQCFAGNDWSKASFYGPTTCSENGDINKMYMYSVDSNTPIDYNSRNVYKCANKNQICDCKGFAMYGFRYNKKYDSKSGERNWDGTIADRNKIVESNGSIRCNPSDFGLGNWDLGARGKPNFRYAKHCWCAANNE